MQLTDADVLEWKLIVYKIAHAYWRKMYQRAELDDYIGEGFLGLIQGLQDYDVTRCPNKKAFLGKRITWAIIAAIKRDDPTTRRGYEQGVRVRIEQMLPTDDEVFISTSRELEQCVTFIDLERLFAVMLDEERIEFRTFLQHEHDPRSKWSAESFARPKCGVTKPMVSGFARMQNAVISN